MRLPPPGRAETQLTVGTLERLCSCVQTHVDLQAPLGGEGVAADVAAEELLTWEKKPCVSGLAGSPPSARGLAATALRPPSPRSGGPVAGKLKSKRSSLSRIRIQSFHDTEAHQALPEAGTRPASRAPLPDFTKRKLTPHRSSPPTKGRPSRRHRWKPPGRLHSGRTCPAPGAPSPLTHARCRVKKARREGLGAAAGPWGWRRLLPSRCSGRRSQLRGALEGVFPETLFLVLTPRSPHGGLVRRRRP